MLAFLKRYYCILTIHLRIFVNAFFLNILNNVHKVHTQSVLFLSLKLIN